MDLYLIAIPLFTVIGALAWMALHYYRRVDTMMCQRDKAIRESEVSQRELLKRATRVAELAGVDSREFSELLAERALKLRIVSDVWDEELPYGQWAEFPDPDGDPPALIRGFWPAVPGKIIGVMMPTNSKFVTHKHPWPETLIGISGAVMVSVGEDAFLLKPGKSIAIPKNAPHAILRAAHPAQFLCIWGETEE